MGRLVRIHRIQRHTTSQSGQSDDRFVEQIERLVMQARRLGHSPIERALRALLAVATRRVA